jgi:hypothetical protein
MMNNGIQKVPRTRQNSREVKRLVKFIRHLQSSWSILEVWCPMEFRQYLQLDTILRHKEIRGIQYNYAELSEEKRLAEFKRRLQRSYSYNAREVKQTPLP